MSQVLAKEGKVVLCREKLAKVSNLTCEVALTCIVSHVLAKEGNNCRYADDLEDVLFLSMHSLTKINLSLVWQS